jgi:acyl transferase domain-containing protein
VTDANKDLLLQSIKTIRQLRDKLALYEQRDCADVAIVGIACRFPGAVDGIESYWDLLRVGGSGVGEVGAERWSNRQFVDPDYAAAGKLVTPYAGMLEGIYDFDAEFFGLSAVEAENLDPQQRLLLEQSWFALEDAGFDIARLRGSDTGVFVGIGSQDYGMALLADAQHANAYVASGNSLSMAAGRLSYFYDFNGPSLSIDTACSSSLVAVHEACRKLRQGDCQLALAAGVNAILTPHAGINFSRARMLTTERDCHVFDARAKGYVRGEGCGVVVLKRLADALAAGDRVHAVIKSVAINHDGHSSGLTVPNGSAQEAVIRSALQQAGLTPGDISYVEAHGTGTSLGDPIEARALAAVFAEGHDADHPLLVGAVKANIGHLEAAAGIAGLIKAALVVSHGEVPPQLAFEELNPKIDWNRAVFNIARQVSSLQRRDDRPLCAGVSSFGFSGTNAHAIVMAPMPLTRAAAPASTDEQLLALSARSPSALREHVEETLAYLRAQSAAALPAISHTSALRRIPLAERVAVTGHNGAELAQRLRLALDKRELERRGSAPRRARVVVFLSAHDDPVRLQALYGALLASVSEPATPGGDRAQAHRQLLARLSSFGVFPAQVIVQGIEAAYVRAWLAGQPVPTGLAYLTGGDELTLADADANLPRDPSPDWQRVVAETTVLAQRTPPFALPASTDFHALGSHAELRGALAALFTTGLDIDWTPLYPNSYAAVADFPRRRFERKSFKSPRIATFMEAPDGPAERIHPLVRSKLAQPDGWVAYTLDFTSSWLDFIDQHRVRGHRLLPASLLLELMRRLAGDALGGALPRLSAVSFQHPVDIDLPRRDYLLQIERTVANAEAVLWSRVAETPDASWTRHASASCWAEDVDSAVADDSRQAVVADWQPLDVAALYDRHQASGVALGQDFRCVRRLRASSNLLECEVSLPHDAPSDPMQRTAILLDGCFQASAGGREVAEGIHLLAAIGQAALAGPLPLELRVRLVRTDSADGPRFDIAIADSEGRALGRFSDVFFKRLPDVSATVGTAASACFYAQQWLPMSWPERTTVAPLAKLPVLAELLDRCEPSTVWAERFGLDEYNAYRQHIEQVCVAIVANALWQLGWRGIVEPPEAAASQCGIVPAQSKLFGHLIAALGRQGQPVSAAPSVVDFDALLESYPRFRAESLFVQRCAQALAEVLQGRRDPLDVLFRGAALEGSEAVYIDSPISRVLNEQLGQIAAVLGDGRPLRILEIGAGTGGTSRSVLDALRGVRVETYCYTDISPLFLERARTLFDEHGFMDYRRLDIEQPIAEQDFEAGSFDLVIAANVLHATLSMAHTLRNVRDLLAPGGYLLLRECIKPQLSADISFGMTEGWWRFEDHALRPDYPLLSTPQWEQQLAARGFDGVRSLLPRELSAEALIVAQAERGVRSERWLVVHDGQGKELLDLLDQQGVAYLELAWRDAVEATNVPDDVAFDYLICFPDAGSCVATDPAMAATELYESMIAFCRHWLVSHAARQARLWCVTTQAERVIDADRLDGLAQSVMTGVLKCAALEFPGRIGGTADLQGEDGELAQVLEHIRKPGPLRYLAVRGGTPYAPRLQPLAQPRQAVPAIATQLASASSVVLITGGLGGIGFALAQSLAPRVAVLVLVGRQVDGESQRARLQALREHGARVIAMAADLADSTQVADLFARLHAEGLRVDHLVHAAGVGGDRLLSESRPGDLRDVVAGKLAGTWHLHLHAPRELKSFMVLSTMVGLWGAKQKTHYVLANHFADRVVQLRRGLGHVASVLQLGPVDSGMLDAAGKAAALRVGVRSFDVREVAALLSEPLPQAESALLDIDWARFKSIYRFSWLDAFFEQIGASDVTTAQPAHEQQVGANFRRDFAALPPTRREGFLDEQLLDLLRAILGLGGDAASYLHTGFHDLGMDSLLTMSFAEKLSMRTGLAVSSVDIFDNANLARLRTWLFARLAVDSAGTSPAGLAPVAQAVSTTSSELPSGTLSTDEIERELLAMQAVLEDR